MPLSTQAQAIFDHAKNSLPKWFHSGRYTVLEWMYGFTAIFEAVYDVGEEWLNGIYLNTATGRWLDQHAKDRDTVRRFNETDDVLRERLRQVEDAITDPALQVGINAIIGASVTLPFDSILYISDINNTVRKPIYVEGGTYTAKEITSIIREGLFPGWNFQIINARARFTAQDPSTNEYIIFTVEWEDEEFRTALGFDSSAIDWETVNQEYYQSDNLIPGFCAITHLRRNKAHMQPVSQSTSFISRGYRMTYAGRPMLYVVLLPEFASDGSPITQATANAVSEYLRQYGPAGYQFQVELTL